MKLIYRILLIINFCTNGLFAQNIDSVKFVYNSSIIDSIQFNCAHFLAKYYWEINTDSSLYYGNTSIRLAQKINNKIKYGDAIKTIGVTYDYIGNLDSCLKYLNESLSVYKSLNKIDKQANVINDIALAYYFRGVYELSLKYHFEALRLRQIYGNQMYISTSYNNLGLVYRSKKDYEKAIYYYKKSLIIKQNEHDEQGMINAYINIGSAYQNSCNYDSAYYYSKKSLQISKQNNLQSDILASEGNMASALINLKRTKEALTLLEDVESKAIANNKKQLLFTCYEGLGDLYILENKLNKAKFYYEKGIDLATDFNRKEAKELFYRKLAHLNFLLGNYKYAYNNILQSKSINDSMFNAENIRQMNELTLVYETAEKEKEINELNAEKKIATNENNRKTQQNIYLLITAILFFGLSILAYLAYITNKRKNKQLNEKNDIIEIALKDKEILMREIHHRVKNNLQIVSSLLSLQSNFIKDEKALEIVNDSRNRVYSMSLIHQSLYNDSTVTKINLQDYISKLLTNLGLSYNLNQNIIHFEKDIEPLILDVDTIVPIGLIINELVTNSLKYAFNNWNGNGVIIVKFESQKDMFHLGVYDNGSGYDNSFNDANIQSFGHKMIHAFLKKLQGEMKIRNENGTKVDVYFKK